MTQQQIEDANGTIAEVSSLGGNVELAIGAADGDYFVSFENGALTVSLVLTPRQARALARQLLQQADVEEYGDEG